MKKKAHKPTAASSQASRVLAAAAARLQKGNRSWFDKLKPSDQKWVEEIRREYVSGSHPNLNASVIAKAVSEEIGTEVSGQAMRTWLRIAK